MPYPPQHRREVKKKIIDSARRLFNRRGFEEVSIAEIMKGAGLTHGGSINISIAKVIFTPK
jgi:TetR/AcrR family transcriptional regulator, transcriptional repressor for nem operon